MRPDAITAPWSLAASPTPAMTTTMTDDALVAASLAGATDAFDELVTRHRRAVYFVCYRFVNDHEDAADLTQDTFVRAWTALPGFRG